MKNISIYIHIPFCLKKCKYCSFYSIEIKNKEEYIQIFIKSLAKEIQMRLSKMNNFKVKSIYFGGGTPSIINESYYEKIFNILSNYFNITYVKEITMEVNPENVEAIKFNNLKQLGINRVSLGVQTFNDKSLSTLGRIYSLKKIYNSIDILRKIFININLDLIYGIPDENLKILERNIFNALSFNPKHISIYNLEYYKDTKLFEDLNIKKIYKWSDLEEKEGYKLIREILIDNGFVHYEISNFSIKNFNSIHNLNYWLGGEYLGFGPSAYSFLDNSWFRNGNLFFYFDSIKKNTFPILKREVLSYKKLKKILFILNLRLLSGVNLRNFIDLDDEFYDKLNLFIKRGLIIKDNNKLKLNPDRIVISNSIFSDLL